ncbi:MAG: hypothetical protein ACREJ3_17600 [Polyangiaceae bacterium]
MTLLACPFCREMFEAGERDTCPVCAMPLTPFERLPLSEDAANEAGAGIAVEPEHERLPATYLGRGRGLLAGLAVLGLAAFFVPWIHLTMPDVTSLSGFDLSRRLGWAWGSGVGWFILLPTVLSRRSIAQMRGARLAAWFLAAVPGVTAVILLARPPHGSHGVPVRFTFEAGLYTTLALSLVAVCAALVLGGRSDDIRLRHGAASTGETVH